MSRNGCQHKDRGPAGRVCTHLIGEKDPDYIRRFTGAGIAYDLLCAKCGSQPDTSEVELVNACDECVRAIEDGGTWEGILGKPEARIGQRNLRFRHETIDLPELDGQHILDVQPVEGLAGVWIALTQTGSLVEVNIPLRAIRAVARVPPDALDFDGGVISEAHQEWLRGPRCVLRVSRFGEVAAVANTYGEKGVVLDLASGTVTMRLGRGTYHEDVSIYPLAFCEMDNRLVVIHGTAWNRLDASDAKTGALLTQRHPTSYKRGEARPEHYLDYFHGRLSVSPSGLFIAENGWVWHPVGIVAAWSISRWLHDNVWESDDGESKGGFCPRWYHWDAPLCWIDDYLLAVWGYGGDDEWLIPAVCIFDVRTGKLESWFAGPQHGSLVFDAWLFSFSPKGGTTAWDVATGERVVNELDLYPAGYHRGAKQFLSLLGGNKLRVSSLESCG